MTNKYFEGTENDSSMRKVLDFFSEEVFGRMPRPEKIIEQRGFKNTSEISKRFDKVESKLVKLEELNKSVFGNENAKKFANKVNKIESDLSSLAVFTGSFFRLISVTVPLQLGAGIISAYNESVAEKKSGINKNKLDEDLENLREEYRELSSLMKPLGIQNSKNNSGALKFNNEQTVNERKEKIRQTNNQVHKENNNESNHLKDSLKRRLASRSNKTSLKKGLC